ncbi:MAG: hypothetical protein KDD46_09075, partial [Bdellovibrionales bacterium]|nr:hypothetical protein [Bdellovibrionales bacterium]
MDESKEIVEETALEQEESRYIANKSIGIGGSAWVFKAFDTVLEKTVCLKLASGPKENEDLKDVFHRFEKEARILSSMNHPNIVQCY